MKNQPADESDIPSEIDFRKGVRMMPVSIERSVWEYFSSKAEQRGIELSELVTEVLRRDIEINEAMK